MLKLFVGFFLLFMVVLLGIIAVKPVMAAIQKFPKLALLVVGSACLAVYFNAAGISLVQTSTLQLDQAQIKRSQAWIKVCELLDELDPDWFRKDGTGLDLALNSIRSLATKGKESA